MKNKFDIKEDDMFEVNDFANLVDTTKYTLHYYDEKDIFKPAMHGSGAKSKYRYYSPTQITAFNMIRVLTEINVSLEMIKSYADGGRTPESLLKLLTKQKEILTDNLNFIQERHSLISTQIDLLTIGLSAMENEISIREMPETPIILGGVNDFKENNNFYGEFVRFYKGEHDPKLNPAYPIGGYWESWDDFLYESSMSATLPTRFFSLDPRGKQKKPAGLYMIAYTRGYYGQTNDLPQRMVDYANEHGYIFTGEVYHIYPFDELCMSDPNQYLLQACAAVKEKRREPKSRLYNPR